VLVISLYLSNSLSTLCENSWIILYHVGGAFGVTDQATRLFTLLGCRLHPSVLQSFYYSSIQTHIQHEISSCWCPLSLKAPVVLSLRTYSANSLLKILFPRTTRVGLLPRTGCVWLLPRTNCVGLLPRTASVKSKSHCDWRSVSQSVSLGVEPHLGLMTRHLLLFDSYGLVFCGAPSLTRGRVCLLSESLRALVCHLL
jgi:hypothetical protein